MILWQMFSFSKKMGLKNLPIEIQDRRRMYLALGIAIVQSLAVSLNLPINCRDLLLGLAIRPQLPLWDWGLHCHLDGKYDGQSALSNHG